MKRAIVILESISYDMLMETETPNIDSLGEIHLAYSHGSWTLPSITSLINGNPPATPGMVFMDANPFLLRDHTVYFYTSNSWIIVLLKAYLKIYPTVNLITYDYDEYTPEMIKDLKNRTGDYLAFLHVMETHAPYRTTKGEVLPEERDATVLRERQKSSLRYIDNVLAELFAMPVQILLMSDHGENFNGEIHGNFDGIFRPEIFRVPLVARNWEKIIHKE